MSKLFLYCHFFIFIVCFLSKACGSVEEIRFFVGSYDMCLDNEQSICSMEVPDSQNHHDCMALCHRDKYCTGVTLDVSNKTFCVRHFQCQPNVYHCEEHTSPNHQYYSKNCGHNGKWNPVEGKCFCVDGWVGPNCLNMPGSVSDMFLAGYQSRAYKTYYNLLPAGLGLVPVKWHLVKESGIGSFEVWSTRGTMNFNRTWTEYSNGFSIDSKNQWAGLEVWRSLILAGNNKLYIQLDLETYGYLRIVYYNVALSEKSDGYRLYFERSAASKDPKIPEHVEFGDCLSPVQGVPFSTADHDQDGTPAKNCAATIGSGWWFNGTCDKPCNFLGWGPSHWYSIPQAQRMHVEGIPNSLFTPQRYPIIYAFAGTH